LRFTIYCQPCHGPAGDGKGIIAQAALDGGPRLTVTPANLTDARVRGLPAGKIYSAIKNGVNNGNMGSYASQVPVEDRWAIVAYVRELQRGVDPNVQDEGGEAIAKVDTSKGASVEAGAALYKAKGCNACHSLDGSRLVGPSFKGVWGRAEKITGNGEITVDEAYVKESLLTPLAKVVEGFPPAMPPQVLTDVEVQSIIMFLKEQK
jgi:mono/diheme cytochrome c family protein